MNYQFVQALIDTARVEGMAPALVVDVGNSRRSLWTYAAGHLTYDNTSPKTTLDTIFDLASLTKVIATTTITMRYIDSGIITLDDKIGDHLSEWTGDDRSHVTIRDLLNHSSGLTAHLPFFNDYRGQAEFEAAICQLPLEYKPKSQSTYSDLGFMLLGFILSKLDDNHDSLSTQFADIVDERNWGTIGYRPPTRWLPHVAPTEQDPWRGRLLIGEAHDENCYALGSVAGHAGLFGTSTAVGHFARDTLRALSGEETFASTKAVSTFRQRSSVPNSSRALGWDTMLPTSSCGAIMSSQSIGHTGFTGTSLWLDPTADRYVVLLTNRVCPTRTNDAILRFRPKLHNAIMAV